MIRRKRRSLRLGVNLKLPSVLISLRSICRNQKQFGSKENKIPKVGIETLVFKGALCVSEYFTKRLKGMFGVTYFNIFPLVEIGSLFAQRLSKYYDGKGRKRNEKNRNLESSIVLIKARNIFANK